MLVSMALEDQTLFTKAHNSTECELIYTKNRFVEIIHKFTCIGNKPNKISIKKRYCYWEN